MRVYGLDFTSVPNGKKPITCAQCTLVNGLLSLEDIRKLTSFEQFEQFIRSDGPWIAGLDFPFGQPRKLVENLNWPLSWAGYVEVVGNMSKHEFVDILEQYRQDREKGDKQHMRTVDRKAGSCSPMMLYGVPVAKMFFEGAPRLLSSGASIIPNHPSDSDRIIVEAYPALVARKFVGNRSYKNDTKSKQTAEHKQARNRIVGALCANKQKEIYGFSVRLSDEQIELCIEEPGADLLDSILCAIQSAWAYENKEENYGIPADCDPLEGWIIDPVVLGVSELDIEMGEKGNA